MNGLYAVSHGLLSMEINKNADKNKERRNLREWEMGIAVGRKVLHHRACLSFFEKL